MGYPRKMTYREGEAGTYHCTVRCVRQAALCGIDEFTNKNYEYRRKWIRNQLASQAKLFAIEVIAYAVMNNHLHTVVRTRPEIADKWSAKEVAVRWLTLFPPRNPSKANMCLLIAAITADKERIKTLRARLCSLSWFNKILNERIAKLANQEDKVKGHFWEGRFYSQKILDIPGAIACSVYVDLNPIRAGKSKTPEDSEYTSIQDRINALRGQREHVQLLPISLAFRGQLSFQEYLTLVDLTGRVITENKASIPQQLAPILERLGIKPGSWIEISQHFKRLFRRVVGTKKSIDAERQLKGINYRGAASADKVFLAPLYRAA